MFVSIGIALVNAREGKDFSVSYMSRITGYSARSIYRYENDILMPSLEYVVHVAKLCGVSTDKLLGIDN